MAGPQNRQDVETAINLDQITVTATRGEKQLLDVPGTVSVISRQDLEQRITRDTQDLVRYEPGVIVNRQTTGTDPFGNYGGFTIRGVGGNRVQMQVDGSRVIERITDGNRDFVDLPFLKNVEIVRGPGSVLWGADALGGIVAYRTLDPQDLLKGRTDKPWAVKLDSSYDSLDRSFVKTAIGAYSFSPAVEAILGVSQRSANEAKLGRARADGGRWGCPVPTLRYLGCNQLNPLDTDVRNAFGKLVFRPSPDHTVKLTGEYFDSDSKVNQLWDYNVVSLGTRNGAYIRDQAKSRQRLAIEHEWQAGLSFLDSLRWQASFSPQEREIINNRLQTLSNGQPRYTRGLLDYKERFSQLDIQAKSSFALGPTFHRLTYGFQGDITRTDYQNRSDVKNLTTGVTTTSIAGGFNFANATTARYDFYLQDEIELLNGRWTITPGLRYANYNIDPRLGAGYQIVPGKEPRELDSHRFIPQIGTLFKLDETYSLYARYAEGFKMPTAQQLYTSLPFGNQNLIPNPDLRPERVKSYEAGVRGRFADGWFSLGAPGECCWLAAPSGHGKSTLVKAIAGLWPHGEGMIERPEGAIFFAPQQPYLPLGSLATALAYPALPETFSAEEYRSALDAVDMAHLWAEDEASWIAARHGLSGGERQRLALARLHLHRPEWIVLDEATSALDAEAERELLARLRETLPHAAIIVIAHRKPQGLGPVGTIALKPQPSSDRPDPSAHVAPAPVG